MFGYKKPDTFENVVQEVTVSLYGKYSKDTNKNNYRAKFTPNPRRVKAIVKNVLQTGSDVRYFGGISDFEDRGWYEVEVNAAVEVLRNLDYTVIYTSFTSGKYCVQL